MEKKKRSITDTLSQNDEHEQEQGERGNGLFFILQDKTQDRPHTPTDRGGQKRTVPLSVL